MGSNSFAPYTKKYGCFIVLNISDWNNIHGPGRKKVIKVFNYPILPNQSRDLLDIPGVGEADIKVSLLKGELRHKLLAKDITIICSDIDLIQFNEDQKNFLKESGVIFGLDGYGLAGVNNDGGSTPSGVLSYSFRDEIYLTGSKNGANRTFFTPEKFINGTFDGNNFHIQLKHNGKDVYEGIDYVISESGGVGTGYDAITFISFAPNSHSLLVANYVVKL